MNVNKELFMFDGKARLGETLTISFQHVMAMMLGCITPAIIIAGAAKLDAADKILLIQMSLIVSGLQTILQVLSIKGYFGARLPMIMGVSFAYVPTMSAIAGAAVAAGTSGKDAVGMIIGAQLVGGFVSFIFGIFVKYLKPLFPPLVTGTVVFTIGLSLYPIAIRYLGGGSVKASNFGSAYNWILGGITLAIAIFLNYFTKGFLKLASVLTSMVLGYIISALPPFNMVSFSSVANAGWILNQNPVNYFTINFETGAIISFAILFVVNSVQAIGDFTATTVGGMDREPTSKELRGGIMAYGISNMIGGVFGCLPTATYSQNVGLVGITKVVNKWVFTFAGIIIVLAGFIPKFSAILTTIPYPVLGGATISVFATIAMTGIKLIAKQPLSVRNTGIVGLSVAIGMGVTQVSGEAANVGVTFLPGVLKTIFGTSPVVLTTLFAILLNNIIPIKAEDKLEE